jgi:transcriptional regulator with XRE-family HTH domain
MVLSAGKRSSKLPAANCLSMLETGQNIKTIRELKNFTQDYVATRLNMSIPNYSNIETGKTDVTLTRLEQIANVLQIDYHQILNLDREQILKVNGHSSVVNPLPGDPSLHNELLKQLQMKDEQINRLLAILEKSNL